MRPRSFQFSLELIGELIKIVISQPLSFLQVDTARLYITEKRLQEAKKEGDIKHMNDSDYSIKNTVRHNLESLDPKIAFARPMALLGPLLGVDSVVFNHPNLKVLIIGPRTEAEILLYISKGFSPSNIYGLDLITYSEFIVAGDMHNIPFSDNFFDVVMCVGTFTFGHVKPPALDEFIRITKNKGLICFTINEGIHEEYGFDKKIDQLKKDNKWKEIEFFKSNYIASKDVNAWLGLYEVIK